MKKLAVFFPGVGYTNDRPLMYHSRKIAQFYDYEILKIDYTGFPDNILGDAEMKNKSFMIAMEQAEAVLNEINFEDYDDVVFVSKSIGTLVAGAYTAIHQLDVRNIFFTPIPETFDYVFSDGICFIGNDDPWADSREMVARCNEKSLNYYTYEDANHSLEVGDVQTDLTMLKNIMMKVEMFFGDTLE